MNSKTIIVIVLTIFLLIIVIQRQFACGLEYQSCIWAGWTGLGASTDPVENYHGAKTLWDWLDLLIVPILLAIGAWWLNRSQEQIKLQIEADKQRQSALENYFDKMTDLVCKFIKIRETNKSQESATINSMIRTRTLSLMRTMDGSRKGQALQFIYELGLLGNVIELDLRGIDLSGADLSPANLKNAHIKGAYINNANLKDANLANAVLKASSFSDSDFTNAYLVDADFEDANLCNANFTNADFKNVKLDKVILDGADLLTAKNLTVNMLEKIATFKNAKLPAEFKDLVLK